MTCNSNNIAPFLRWAGGKRWLIHNYPEMFPASFDKYIEPFLGSGAIFFSLKPKKAILSDLNEDLIDVYKVIKTDAKKLHKLLNYHQRKHSKKYYYEIRGKIPKSDTYKAARFIYLNRTCWNGLYRVNMKGIFNVPIGSKVNVVLPTDDYQGLSNLLKRANLAIGDFEPIIAKAKENDFVFIDPPYTVKHNNNNFRKYNELIFSWEDQIRLRDSLFEARDRGAKILVCNADNSAVKYLYRGFGRMKKVYRNSLLAANPTKRQRISEIVIRSKNLL